MKGINSILFSIIFTLYAALQLCEGWRTSPPNVFPGSQNPWNPTQGWQKPHRNPTKGWQKPTQSWQKPHQNLHQNDEQNMHPGSNLAKAVIDLGIDYNDEPVLDYFKDIIARSIVNDSITNEYGNAKGEPRLRQAIAQFYSNIINHKINWETEVITTVGATEALATTFRALSQPGDEWIVIEPFFNMFKGAIELANAVPRYTSLKVVPARGEITASKWRLNITEMESLINRKTRGILFNNPNNPIGKTYTKHELKAIADLAERHDLIIVTDEVHEFTTDKMIKMASLKGMYNRTITIGSASKAFCIPGWRIGWIFGPTWYMDKISPVHQNSVNFVATAQQRAVAMVFEDEYEKYGSADAFLSKNLDSIKRKREFIVKALRMAGMVPIVPDGGYCMLAGWPALKQPYARTNLLKGNTFANFMEKNIRIHAYPADKYYGDLNKYQGIHRLRFCYHKKNETLQNAAKYLLELKATSNSNQNPNKNPGQKPQGWNSLGHRHPHPNPSWDGIV